MKNIFLVFSMLFIATNCGQEETKQTEKCNAVIIDSNQFNNSQSDSFNFISLNFENECLKIRIQYGGGCEEISAQLIDNGDVFESNPVQGNLRILFTDNDECEALIEKNFFFNLSNLQDDNENKVLLNFQGSDLTYLYEY